MNKIFIFVFFVATSGSAFAEMWKYEDASGEINFTNDFNSIPPKFRGKAKPFVPKAESAVLQSVTVADKRREVSSYSEDEARLLLREGRLTEDEVRYLVEHGVLRATEVGDALRFAGRAVTKPVQAVTNENMTDAERTAALAADIQKTRGSANPVGSVMDQVNELKKSPNFTNSLIGEGILAAVLIIAMPFVMRNYNSDSTRRLIRFSFLATFVVLSLTMNAILFRDEIEGLMSLAAKAKSPAPAKETQVKPEIQLPVVNPSQVPAHQGY